jgi:hypothetical protein
MTLFITWTNFFVQVGSSYKLEKGGFPIKETKFIL